MGEAAIKTSPEVSDAPVKSDDKSPKEKVLGTHTEEFVIGLCGFIGTDIHTVSSSLNKILTEQYGYRCKEIRLSKFIIEHHPQTIGLDGKPALPDDYSELINKFIDEGNELRKKHGYSILAELAVNQIITERVHDKEEKKHKRFRSRRTCYIINSIKNKEELELLKSIYGDLFYSIGIFSDLGSRKQFLIDKGTSDSDAQKLIDRDSDEKVKFGQEVRETFTQSDFFLRIQSTTDAVIETKLKRFLHLVFGSAVITPLMKKLQCILRNQLQVIRHVCPGKLVHRLLIAMERYYQSGGMMYLGSVVDCTKAREMIY